MAVSARLPHTKSDEHCRRSPTDAATRQDNSEPQRDADRDGNGERVAEGERTERAPHGAPASLLHTQRDREEPAHSRIETVEGAQ